MVISNLLLGICIAFSGMNAASHTFLKQEIQGSTLDLEEKSQGKEVIVPKLPCIIHESVRLDFASWNTFLLNVDLNITSFEN